MTNLSSVYSFFSENGFINPELVLHAEGISLISAIWETKDKNVLKKEMEKLENKEGQELEAYVQELRNSLNGDKSNSCFRKWKKWDNDQKRRDGGLLGICTILNKRLHKNEPTLNQRVKHIDQDDANTHGEFAPVEFIPLPEEYLYYEPR